MIVWALYHKVASLFDRINGRRMFGMSRSFICVVGFMVCYLLVVVKKKDVLMGTPRGGGAVAEGPPTSAKWVSF